MTAECETTADQTEPQGKWRVETRLTVTVGDMLWVVLAAMGGIIAFNILVQISNQLAAHFLDPSPDTWGGMAVVAVNVSGIVFAALVTYIVLFVSLRRRVVRWLDARLVKENAGAAGNGA